MKQKLSFLLPMSMMAVVINGISYNYYTVQYFTTSEQ